MKHFFPLFAAFAVILAVVFFFGGSCLFTSPWLTIIVISLPLAATCSMLLSLSERIDALEKRISGESVEADADDRLVP